MTVTCVIQARVGSRRLPGKVLADLGGVPLLTFLLRRLRAAEGTTVDDLVVATSEEAGDDAVARIAGDEGVAVVRGSEADVLSRFQSALDAFPADWVVRVTADCPLIDPQLVADAVAAAHESDLAYVSNTLVRTFPDGLDVEVVRASALREAIEDARDPAEREHVTPYVYRQPDRFPLGGFFSGYDLGHERWTVDTADDLERIRGIVSSLADPVTAGWRDIATVAGRTPPPTVDGVHVVPDVEAPLRDGQRAWIVRYDGDNTGRVRLEVHGYGVGHLTTTEVPDELRVIATALVRDALAGDLQVVTGLD